MICLYYGTNAFLRVMQKVNMYYQSLHNDKINNIINIKFAEKTSSLDIAYYDTAQYYNELENVRRDSGVLPLFTWTFIDCVKAVVQLIIAASILINLNIYMTFILIATAFPGSIAEIKLTYKIYKWDRTHIKETRKMGYLMSLFSNVNTVRDIKMYGIFNYLIEKYNVIWREWFKNRKKILKLQNILTTILLLIPEIIIAGMIIYIGINILNGQNTVGDYSLYGGCIGQLSVSIYLISRTISQMYTHKSRVDNYINFMNWENNVKNGNIKHIYEPLEIEFVDVSFKYPNTDRYVLKRLNFKISGKEKIGIVGLNGAGKSTLIKLILRFYDPSEGKILLNGIDLKQYDQYSLWKNFSVLFQGYTNYAFTLKENITISNYEERENMGKIKYAAEKGDIINIINRYNTGLDTYISRAYEEDGQQLSVGEEQKVAISRTFFRDSHIIILDEPSASLDPQAEHKIFIKFNELCENKALILITHRLSSITMVNRIIVINEGEIIEDGSHYELMKQNGMYNSLYNLQASKYINGNEI